MKKQKSGLNQTTFEGARSKEAPKTIEEWILDEKRFEERLRYEERIQYRCTIIGIRGFEIKCTGDCTTCSYYWKKRPNKVSFEHLEEEGVQLASSDENPIEYAQRKKMEEVVSNAIVSLPSEDLRAVARMFANSCSFTEIGEALGISKQAAHKKWLQTKELLRLALQDYWDSINS